MGAITIPAATISAVDTIAVLIGVVLYDQVLTPFLAKIGRPISNLQRIGIGYCFAMAAMIVAAGIESYRLKLVAQEGIQNDPDATVNMTWAWQIPQYSLVGLSEVFANIGTMQLFYEAAPESLRSVCSALYCLAMGISGFLSSALVMIIQGATATNGKPGWIADNVNAAHFDYFFALLAAMQLVDIIVYIWVARRYTRLRPPVSTIDDSNSAGTSGRQDKIECEGNLKPELSSRTSGTKPPDLIHRASRTSKPASSTQLGKRPDLSMQHSQQADDSARGPRGPV